MNRFTPDDLIAKGYKYDPFPGQWVRDIQKRLSPTKKAPDSLYMPKATPKPAKRRKTARDTLLGPSVAFRGVWCGTPLAVPTPEYRFDPSRRWRFDYAFISQKIAVEVQGGIWTNGRHTRGAALLKEWEKLNRAAELGWRILYVQPSDLLSPLFIAQLKRTLTPE